MSVEIRGAHPTLIPLIVAGTPSTKIAPQERPLNIHRPDDQLLPTVPFRIPLELAAPSAPSTPTPVKTVTAPIIGGGSGGGSGGSGGGGNILRIIAEARGAVAKGDINLALMYLDAITRASINANDRAGSTVCLDEAERIIQAANTPEHFQWELRATAHNATLGRSQEAEAGFSRVMGYIPNIPHSYKRDEIRFAVALTYADIGRMEEAKSIALSIEEQVSRFSALIPVGLAYVKHGDIEVGAKDCFLYRCTDAAREHKDPLGVANQLLCVAENLIKIGTPQYAKWRLDEVLDRLLPLPLNEDISAQMERIEKAGEMLLQLGHKEEVIARLGSAWEWLDDETHRTHFDTPEKLRTARIKEVAYHYPKLAKYFEG